MLGKAFNTNRSQLTSGAARKLARVRSLLQARKPTQLLVVGHCDTTGDDAVNDPLSFERAQSTIAFLKDDVQAWLDMYNFNPASRRWGAQEDLEMIGAAKGFSTKPKTQDAVRWFQQARGLEVDGIAGPITRRALIEEYMALDGEPFAALGLSVGFTAHGCGEHFPLDESGRELDRSAADNNEDAMDRRVEFFFFPKIGGVRPPPAGNNSNKDSAEYPEWRRKSRLDFETVIVEGEDDLFLRLHVEPETKDQQTDKLRLFAVQGGYTQTRVAALDGEVGNGFIDVVYTRVSTNLNYSLEVTPAAGEPYFMFKDVPHDQLDGFVEPGSDDGERHPLEPEPNLDDEGKAV